jgi:undecaprenyl diphosphate synthase
MRALKTELAKLPTKGVRFRLLGQWPPLDPALMGMLQEAQARTRHNTGLHLNLLPARPQKQAWAQTAHFQVTHPPPRPDGLAVDSGESQHCDPAPTEPDLLIRTGGCPTAEDAMVWDTSHTALYFTDLPWPDVSAAVFRQAVRWYGLEDRARGVQIGRASLGVQRHNPCAAL